MALFKSIKIKIAPYFLEEAGPFSKKASYKPTNIKRVGLGLIFITILVLLFSGEDPRKTNSGVVPTFQIRNQSAQTDRKSQSAQTAKSGAGGSFGSALGSGGIGYGNSRTGAPPSRNHSANQVIRRGANGTDPDSQLPMGYSISVKLLNAIYSTNTGSPVVAEVTSDVSGHTGVSIPEHTHVIGEASFDESAQRLKVHFHTFVYPEGDQHSVQGLGLMADGSAGLDGDYHSGNGTRQLGRFLGTFVSGVADGMIERQSGGMFGSPYETASVRNGVLNGVTLSAQDQTKMVTDQLSRVKPSMTLPAGTHFLLYLEKEYSP